MPPNETVSITLDRKRNLRYPMRAMEAIERETGKNLMADIEAFFENLSATEWVTVVWAGLLHEDQEVSREVVLDHVELDDMPDISSKVLRAMGATEDEMERIQEARGIGSAHEGDEAGKESEAAMGVS